jgi:hypothetical protein
MRSLRIDDRFGLDHGCHSRLKRAGQHEHKYCQQKAYWFENLPKALHF